MEPSEFVTAVLMAYAGLDDFSRQAAGIVLRDRPSLGAAGAVGLLTPREQRIMACLAKGYRTKDIAEALRMSGRTVEWHVGNIHRKLGVHRRAQALSRCFHQL